MARDMLKPFWLVWTDDPEGGEDCTKHASFEAAKNRARELALAYSTSTYVLHAVGGYILNTPQWESIMSIPVPPQ